MMHRWSNVVVRDRWSLYTVRWSSVISERDVVLFDIFAHTQPCRRTAAEILTISQRTPNDTTVTTLRVDVLRIGSRLVFG